MKTTYQTLALFVLIIILQGCNNSQLNPSPLNFQREKTPEELRAELQKKESDNPLQYLNDNNVRLTPQTKKIRNGGLFREAEYAPDGAIINGNLSNSATLAKFKDITVKVTFYSKTKTNIEEQSYVIYEYYEPNTSKPFSLRLKAIPDAYNSFSFAITGATPVY